MKRTVALNVVGLTESLLGPHTPNLSAFRRSGALARIQPAFPAVTCTAQSNYLTGVRPTQHGIVGNGWFHRELAEVQFWKQSNHLVTAPKLWESLRLRDPRFTCAKLFWWFNMYSGADYTITPRPMYPADGRKVFDVYTWPYAIRTAIKGDLGEFPFPSFWGPAAGVDSPQGRADAASRWIAESAKWIESRYEPTLSLVYLPHLDYNLQRHGPWSEVAGPGPELNGALHEPGRRGLESAPSCCAEDDDPRRLTSTGTRRLRVPMGGRPTVGTADAPPDLVATRSPGRSLNAAIVRDLEQIDALAGDLIAFYQARSVQVVVLSEYGLGNVDQPIHLNRVFRERGWLKVKEELGLELLDAGASRVFAVADHQVAHIYLNDRSLATAVRDLLEHEPGVAEVLAAPTKAERGIDHPRAGDLIAVAAEHAWFTYYYWLDDRRAPDFARTVDIHRKSGYDPAELFLDPDLPLVRLRILARLLQKRLGFRMLMDVVPLDAGLVRGSHGRCPADPADYPVLIAEQPGSLASPLVDSTDVCALLQRLVAGE